MERKREPAIAIYRPPPIHFLGLLDLFISFSVYTGKPCIQELSHL